MFFRVFVLFLCVQNVFMFQHYISKSLDLVRNHCCQYKIDESHNEIHSKEVLYYGSELIKDLNITENEKRILILGCIFHDVVDRKYLNENDNPQDLLQEMLTQVETDKDIINDTTLFMNSMSYSKTIYYDKDNEPRFEEPTSIEFHPNKKIYHLIRNADLLSSYNLRRAFLYHVVKFPHLSFSDVWNDVVLLYSRRMSKLRSNGILDLTNSNCDILSRQLEQECNIRLQTFHNISLLSALEHFNMLPTISTNDLISKF